MASKETTELGYFPDYSEIERIRIFEQNAHEIKDGFEYDHVLSEDELTALRVEYLDDEVEKKQAEEEIKLLVSELKERTSALKKRQKASFEQVRTGRKRVRTRVYLILNEDNNRLEYVNTAGQVVKSEPGPRGMQRNLKFGDAEAKAS